VVNWNPCSLRQEGRVEDIDDELGKNDIVILSGTALRSWARGKHAPRLWAGKHFHSVQFGYGSSPFVNKSCGGTLLLSKRRFGNTLRLQKLLLPEPALRGRVGAALVRSREDSVWVGFAYYPPRPQKAAEMPVYIKTCEMVTEWITVFWTAARNTELAFLGMDVNDQFSGGNGQSDKQQAVVGDAERGKEHEVAAMLREVGARTRTCLVSTFFGTGPSFFGEWGCSKIDHLMIHQRLRPLATRAVILNKAGRRLQLANRSKPWDHWPMQTTFEYKLGPVDKIKREPRPWHQEALNCCLLDGYKRVEVVEAVEKHFKDNYESYKEKVGNSRAPDKAFALLVDGITEGTKGMLDTPPVDLDEDPKQKKQNAKTLREMLHQRRELRSKLETTPEGSTLLARAQQLIWAISRRLKASKRKNRRTLVERRVEALHEQWRTRKFYHVWKLAFQLGATSSGRRRRYILCFLCGQG